MGKSPWQWVCRGLFWLRFIKKYGKILKNRVTFFDFLRHSG